MAVALDAAQHLSRDPTMKELVERYGELRLKPANDTYQRLVLSVVRQQVSTASAEAIKERLFNRFEVSPESMMEVDKSDLVEVGLSQRKAEYVKNIGEAYIREGYDKAYFEEMTDHEVINELTCIRGVGDWTAKMYLIFCLGREDVFPIEDLGIRRGIEELYGDTSQEEMKERSEEWQPFRSYASLYIWRAHEK